jgi:hypothetical protein
MRSLPQDRKQLEHLHVADASEESAELDARLESLAGALVGVDALPSEEIRERGRVLELAGECATPISFNRSKGIVYAAVDRCVNGDVTHGVGGKLDHWRSPKVR